VDRVVTLALGDRALAYPYSVLAEKRVINDTVAGQAVVVFWKGGTASALDSRAIAAGRDIGATGVFSRNVNGKTLTFVADGDKIRDTETGTTWDILGHGIEGALAGQQLAPIVHGDYFWFAWAAFRPDSQVYGFNWIKPCMHSSTTRPRSTASVESSSSRRSFTATRQILAGARGYSIGSRTT
jgi:hypothetical protein